MKLYRKQTGLALIIILTLALVGGLSWLLLNLNKRQYQTSQHMQTAIALAEAKEALLGYAASYDRQFNSDGILSGYYGFLPCPDYNTGAILEGEQDGNCGGTERNKVGRLPWRTLGITPLRDGAGECLWYAVSGNYKVSPRADLLNWDSAGRFVFQIGDDLGGTSHVVGTLVTTSPPFDPQRPIAAIIAPGKRLSGQDRKPPSDPDKTKICGGNYTTSHYLELENNIIGEKTFTYGSLDIDKNAVENIINSQPYNSVINDSIIYITQEELWEAISRRQDFVQQLQCLTQVVGHCVANYGRNYQRLPWPASVNVTDYRLDEKYEDNSGLTSLGRLPNLLEKSKQDLAPLSITQDALLLKKITPPLPDKPYYYFSCDLSQLGSNLSQCPNDNIIKNSELIKCDGTNKDDCLLNKNKSIEIIARLWQNWKDHLFYQVSAPYQINNAITPALTMPICNSNCLTVNGLEYAAVILFAGKREPQQLRLDYPDKTTKEQLTYYLDAANADTDSSFIHKITNRELTDDFAICIGGTNLEKEQVIPCPE
ncbi:hypothetical protein [Thioflexithrix psekupsensis]|uniref:Uncharacterized protein n=1 Tax=Thioflexithrix psekupsensis TaxID=1570016 RepID=A0A251XA06_9GAMM|nr:hypothetical protein [Thioflexithrix psekupsensis]OUD14557.1 hypothetical protein TPSD3_09715 [Thioflexithrix psekupsensis]